MTVLTEAEPIERVVRVEEPLSCAILIPVLNRPERVAPLIESVERTAEFRVVPVFIVSPSDVAEQVALEQPSDEGRCQVLVVGWEPGQGDYAKKINAGVYWTDNPWVFLGADDLCFCPDWLQRALDRHDRTRAMVIGTNDLGNPSVTSGAHSTHSLVSRAYCDLGTVDEWDKLLHEGYWHNFVDNEFVQTAQWRSSFSPAPDSWVEHLHPNWQKARDDATYRLGQERFNIDRALFQSRQRLWGYR